MQDVWRGLRPRKCFRIRNNWQVSPEREARILRRKGQFRSCLLDPATVGAPTLFNLSMYNGSNFKWTLVFKVPRTPYWHHLFVPCKQALSLACVVSISARHATHRGNACYTGFCKLDYTFNTLILLIVLICRWGACLLMKVTTSAQR